MKKYLALGAFLLIASGCGTASLPPDAEVSVPFTPQAPGGDWSEPWQNACEETSLYMVTNFYEEDDIKKEEAIEEIKSIFAVKNEEINVSLDESLATISELIEKLDLPFTTTIVYDPTVDDLKEELAENRPIIVPVYAPELGNIPGVDYHVLVLVGYDDETQEFIVNDPAKTDGQGVHYAYDVFMEAIHDLNSEDYDAGKKAVLFTKETWSL